MMLDGGDEGVEGILGHDHEQVSADFFVWVLLATGALRCFFASSAARLLPTPPAPPPSSKQAMLALARGKQLTEPERTATYAAADNRTDNINKNLDALDLKTANVSFFLWSASFSPLLRSDVRGGLRSDVRGTADVGG